MMRQGIWKHVLLPKINADGVWELFHENSKVGKHNAALSEQEVRTRVQQFHESLSFDGYPNTELPRPLPLLDVSLGTTLSNRESLRDLSPVILELEQVSTLLHYAYGTAHGRPPKASARAFRLVPSGGALYPLELFFYGSRIQTLPAGLYHYNPMKNSAELVREGDSTKAFSEVLVQPSLGANASIIVFLTAVFERSVFKYGDRGYRFVLMEAGHVAQNLNLVATGLGLASVNVGGYIDRQVDNLLGLDGLTQSTVYIIAIGEARAADSVRQE
jgi:SagB-type dehydrogenase family enzyme